jgi:hypothetical protein
VKHEEVGLKGLFFEGELEGETWLAVLESGLRVGLEWV